MSKQKFRRINVERKSYLWIRRHVHLDNYKYSQCVEILTIYQEGYKKSPLRLHFREEEQIANINNPKDSHWAVGYPEDGVIWQTGNKTGEVNLNRPGVVAEIIKFAILKNWDAKNDNTSTDIFNGFEWIEQIKFPKTKSEHIK